MSIFTKWLQQKHDQKILATIDPLVKETNKKEKEISKLTDDELKNKTKEFQNQLKQGKQDNDILAEAFAVLRESSKRTTTMRHFDVQIKGGILLTSGSVAEMKTGEGKTLVAILPAYIHALRGKGVHIVTVNDYLARRDAALMGQVFSFLGMSVGVVNTQGNSYLYDAGHKEIDQKRDEKGYYKVYYDFLRPCTRKEAYAADITYGTNNEFGFDYLRDNIALDAANTVQRGHNFALIDEADSILIDEARIPLIFSSSIEKPTDFYIQFTRLADILKEDEDFKLEEKTKSVLLTSKGIQTTEEKLKIQNLYTHQNKEIIHHLENALRAKVLYKKDKDYIIRNNEVVLIDEFTGRFQIGKMLGGGAHQAIEAKEGVEIHKESKTIASITFQNYFRMYKVLSGMTGTAITSKEEFNKVYKCDVFSIPTHMPVIRKDNSDFIFTTNNGKLKAITKKIKELQEKGQPVLVGTASIQANEELSEHLKKSNIRHNVLNAKNHESEGEIIAGAGVLGRVTVATNLAGRGVDIKLGGVGATEEEYSKIKSLGGLFVLGTERHEARRIDDQLRGRSGRQGDEGETRFFVSMEDSLLRVFASDKIKNIAQMLKVPEDEPIESRVISRSLENAQKRIEGHNFDARKHSLEFDSVIDVHRNEVYKKRNTVLFCDSYDEIFNDFVSEEKRKSFLELDEDKKQKNNKNVQRIILRVIDHCWSEHLSNMDYAKRSVNIRGNPLMEYRKEAVGIFKSFWDDVRTIVNKNI